MYLIFAISSLTGLKEDLETVLTETESQLFKHGFNWQHVLYIHLYISDMGEFAVANETYVKFITQEKCPFGVPSRSTIELPLVQAGFGKAYVEVLVANDHSKRVLHVQSISCWAPSCIGPYSQVNKFLLRFLNIFFFRFLISKLNLLLHFTSGHFAQECSSHGWTIRA